MTMNKEYAYSMWLLLMDLSPWPAVDGNHGARSDLYAYVHLTRGEEQNMSKQSGE